MTSEETQRQSWLKRWFGRIRRRPVAGVAIVSAVLIVAVGGPFAFGLVPEPEVTDCEVLRSIDEENSRKALRADIQDQIAAELPLLQSSQAQLLEQKDVLNDQLTETGESLDEARSNLEAESQKETPDPQIVEEFTREIGLLEERRTALEGELAALRADVQNRLAQMRVKTSTLVEINEALAEALGLQRARLEASIDRQLHASEIEELKGDEAQLEEDNKMLQGDQDQRESDVILATAISKADITSAAATASPIRSSANLQPTKPVALIEFGADREPQRVEIAFESSDFVTSEAEPTTAASEVKAVELPERAVYFTAPGQLSRPDGTEIYPNQIFLWARRLGPTILMSVCISPEANLPAGRYEGNVYLVDPSLDSVKVPVQVTAQFKWIDLLYYLLPILPLLALLYVWYIGRVAAEESPWDTEPFIRWLKINFVLLFAIGFASVWATLQVAFTNPTWGSSLFGAAAVAGGSLVAAVTAVTAVAGRVRGHSIDHDPNPPSPAHLIDAIGEPKRRRILSSLAQSGESQDIALADKLEMTRSAISQHLEVLVEVGLVLERKDGRRRLYSLNPDGAALVQEAIAEDLGL
ncbi:MAG: metalloregulator ArsR/SmtB family transcription factor [Acidimicrobiales bacterium]